MQKTRYLKGEPLFTQWLHFQAERKDAIGGLARYAAADPCWPRLGVKVAHFIMHLRVEHNDKHAPAELTLRDAFDEFRRFLASGGKVPARIGARSRSEKQHRGYFVPPDTVQQIKDLAEAEDLTQGEVLERLVAREHKRLVKRAM